jgi:hypothetical protein
MGAGATLLAGDEDLRAGVEAAGWQVEAADVDPVEKSDAEIARIIELVRRLSGQVRTAVEQDRGNHSECGIRDTALDPSRGNDAAALPASFGRVRPDPPGAEAGQTSRPATATDRTAVRDAPGILASE